MSLHCHSQDMVTSTGSINTIKVKLSILHHLTNWQIWVTFIRFTFYTVDWKELVYNRLLLISARMDMDHSVRYGTQCGFTPAQGTLHIYPVPWKGSSLTVVQEANQQQVEHENGCTQQWNFTLPRVKYEATVTPVFFTLYISRLGKVRLRPVESSFIILASITENTAFEDYFQL